MVVANVVAVVVSASSSVLGGDGVVETVVTGAAVSTLTNFTSRSFKSGCGGVTDDDVVYNGMRQTHDLGLSTVPPSYSVHLS